MSVFQYYNPQKEAIKSILEEFLIFDRTQLISACGTGKTFISKKVAFDLNKDKNESITIVFLSTITLVFQFHDAWISQKDYIQFDGKPLIYCSRSSMIKDKEKRFGNFNKEPLLDYLEDKTIKHKTIITTYQSSIKLCNILKYKNHNIDFGIFDEAHKTVGTDNKDFAHAIYDKNILIKKRLFMTATRLVEKNMSKGMKKINNKQKVNFMDNQELYGRVAYSLSMKEAINQNIIKDFKILVGVIDRNFIESCISEIKENENLMNNILAKSLLKAIEEKNIKKSLIFFSRIKDSLNFTNTKSIKQALGDNIKHLDGNTSERIKQDALNKLAESDEFHVSNAKLFTEGVDSPAVNMVALCSPSYSLVDVIQKIGRMQRKEHKDDTEKGYIFIPLFVQDKLFIKENKLDNKFDWDFIIHVLNYLRETNKNIDIFFNKSGDENFSKKEIQEFLLNNENIEFSNINTLEFDEQLLEDIEYRINIHTYNKTVEDWEDIFSKLVEFKNENDCFPNMNSDDDVEKYLNFWLKRQRVYFAKNILSDDKIEKLKGIGFLFNPLFEKWNQRFEEYKEFKLKYKIEPRANFNNEERVLNKWINDQKRFFKKNKLEDWKIEKLDEVLGSWKNNKEIVWMDYFNQFKNIFKSFKRLPLDNKEETNVCSWVRSQRNKHLKSKLSIDKVKLLDSVTLDWKVDKFTLSWNNNYKQVNDFLLKNDRLPKHNVRDKSEHRLFKWIEGQYVFFTDRNKINHKDRLIKLNKIGISI